MMESELQEVRARADAATPGPWLADHGLPSIVTNDPAHTDYPFVWAGFGSEHNAPSPADLEFIAKAREDIPRLLAEITRLREECDQLRASAARRPAA